MNNCELREKAKKNHITIYEGENDERVREILPILQKAGGFVYFSIFDAVLGNAEFYVLFQHYRKDSHLEDKLAVSGSFLEGRINNKYYEVAGYEGIISFVQRLVSGESLTESRSPDLQDFVKFNKLLLEDEDISTFDDYVSKFG